MDSTRVPIDQTGVSDHSGPRGDPLYIAVKPDFRYLTGSHSGPAQAPLEAAEGGFSRKNNIFKMLICQVSPPLLD